MHRLGQGARKPLILDRHVVELAVGLDVTQLGALARRDACERADLHDHHVVGLLVGDRHVATSESLKIRQARVRPERDAKA